MATATIDVDLTSDAEKDFAALEEKDELESQPSEAEDNMEQNNIEATDSDSDSAVRRDLTGPPQPLQPFTSAKLGGSDNYASKINKFLREGQMKEVHVPRCIIASSSNEHLIVMKRGDIISWNRKAIPLA